MAEEKRRLALKTSIVEPYNQDAGHDHKQLNPERSENPPPIPPYRSAEFQGDEDETKNVEYRYVFHFMPPLYHSSSVLSIGFV